MARYLGAEALQRHLEEIFPRHNIDGPALASVCRSGGRGDSPNDRLKSESSDHRGEEHIWKRAKF